MCGLMHKQLNVAVDIAVFRVRNRAHGVAVSHPLRMRKPLGSIPSVSICQSDRWEDETEEIREQIITEHRSHITTPTAQPPQRTSNSTDPTAQLPQHTANNTQHTGDNVNSTNKCVLVS